MITLCPCGALPVVGPYCLACAPEERLRRPQAPPPVMPLIESFRIRLAHPHTMPDRLQTPATGVTGSP